MNRKILILLLCVFLYRGNNIVLAQGDEFNWSNLLLTYYSQSAPKGNLFLKQILSSKDSFSLNELRTIALCFTYNKKAGISNNNDKVSYVMSSLLDSLKVMECDVAKLSNDGKKKLIRDYIIPFEAATILFSCIEKNDKEIYDSLNEHMSFFLENIYGYRKILDPTYFSDLESLGAVYRMSAMCFYLMGRYDISLLNLYPELLELHDSNKKITDYLIYGVMNNLKDQIVTYGYTEQGKKYIKERCNFLLQLNDLSLLVLGDKNASNYDKTNWERIKASINNDECAVLMYNFKLLGKVDLISGIIISKEFSEPQELSVKMSNVSPNDFISSIEKKYPQYKKLFICPIGEWEDIDVAYCNSKVYMKYSLSDLFDQTKSPSIQDKGISIFANLDYGNSKDKNNLESLNEGEKLLSTMKTLFGKRLHSLSGKNVRKINFYNIIDDIGIFHVSTHGQAVPNDIEHETLIDMGRTIIGETSLTGYGLALSDYNENKDNFISAAEIKETKNPKDLLVFLDACYTNVSSESLMGRASLAKAFYFSGVGNIIAYNIEVKEHFATDFALAFYKEIHDNPTISFHDAFYKAKTLMKNKYENTQYLSKDIYGRPNIGILLWE